ncbi:MAG: hypothetical protein HY321_09710 [Armatimonadetes bacterium]|nr:hypothetical protein [Armatimonadota bacterium]
MAGLLLGASFPALALPAAGDFDIHVDWVSDYTTNPVTEACAYSGTVAAGLVCPVVRVRFNRDWYQGYVWVTSMTIHEVADHVPDVAGGTGGMDVNQRREACGDPDPEEAPGMVYFNDSWEECIAGHNRSHTITVETEYLDIVTEEVYPGPTRNITVDPQNLTVTETTPAGATPILWDPGTMTSVPVTVKATLQKREEYTARLQVYDHTQTCVRTLTQSETIGPGQATVTFQWDGKDGEGQTLLKGVYYFRSAFALPDFEEYDKSIFLTVESVSEEYDRVDPQTGDFVYNVTYSLSGIGETECTECNIAVYDPDLLLRKSVSVPTSLGEPHEVEVPLQMDKGGRWVFVVQATDNGTTLDKGHIDRPALQKAANRITTTWDVGEEISVTVTTPVANQGIGINGRLQCSATATDMDHWSRFPFASGNGADVIASYTWSCPAYDFWLNGEPIAEVREAYDI